MLLPADFSTNMRQLLGNDGFESFQKALDEQPPVSIRLNPLKRPMLSEQCAEQLSRRLGEPVPWCRDGYYLPSRPQFTFDPLLHAGVYYVQEASSMFLDCVLRQLLPPRPVAMLDLCAAPGGKSTVARAALPEGSLLVSNEPMRARAQILNENMLKWGYADVVVTNSYPRDFRRAGRQFDVVLCDVPCSGEGMFRKDAGAIAEWSPQNVERCWRLQREIVADAWECLTDGGLFVYSTCTYNTAENEQNISWCQQQLGAEIVSVDTESCWGITGSLLAGFDQPVYRFIPGRTRGEGLFMAALRKPQSLQAGAKEFRSEELKSLADSLTQNHKVQGSNHKVQGSSHKDKGTNHKVQSTNHKAQSSKSIAKSQNHKDQDSRLVPDISEALSVAPTDKYPRCELSWQQAVAYLRKESLVLPPDVPRGFVVVTFGGAALGFVKNIGSRANNLYPPEWKIKSTHIPNNYDETIS